jgi:hypothetical protein
MLRCRPNTAARVGLNLFNIEHVKIRPNGANANDSQDWRPDTARAKAAVLLDPTPSSVHGDKLGIVC